MSAESRSGDYALESVGFRHFIVHVADCPAVRGAAKLGVPVLTLFGCERPPAVDATVRWHTCMGVDE